MALRRHHDDDDDAEKSRFRWLDAARYTVGAMVTVLIVAVIANAIKVLLRPNILLVSVVGGSMTAKPSPPILQLSVDLLTQNPSGRAVMYYTNVTGYLFDNKTSPTAPNPSNECFHQLQVKDVTVYQERQVDYFTRAKAKRGISMLNASFDLLSGGGIMHSVTLRLDGILTTQTTSVGINTSTPTTYYCPQLVVGGDPDDPAYQGSANVPCTSDVQGGGSRLLMLAAVMVALVQTFVM